MRLERRRVKSDLIETFKTMNGKYDLNRDLFFSSKVVEGMTRNCSREHSDLILKLESGAVQFL